jgi:rubrerythrin
MLTKEVYKTPEIQKNRDEHIALIELHSGLEWALRDHIDKAIKNVKDMGGKVPEEIIKIRKAIKAEDKRIERRLKKLHDEYWRMVDKCEHDFTYEGESYGGNYDVYRCKKCGMIESRK